VPSIARWQYQLGPSSAQKSRPRVCPAYSGTTLTQRDYVLSIQGTITLTSHRNKLTRHSSIAGVTIGISHAKLTPLQVDGGCEVVGSPSDYVGILYPGERVDLLVKWDSKVLSTGSDLEIIMDPE
jgi:hypothetical protein